jgi:hypothetical protein
MHKVYEGSNSNLVECKNDKRGKGENNLRWSDGVSLRDGSV